MSLYSKMVHCFMKQPMGQNGLGHAKFLGLQNRFELPKMFLGFAMRGISCLSLAGPGGKVTYTEQRESK